MQWLLAFGPLTDRSQATFSFRKTLLPVGAQCPSPLLVIPQRGDVVGFTVQPPPLLTTLIRVSTGECPIEGPRAANGLPGHAHSTLTAGE